MSVPIRQHVERPQRLLVIVAHPGDADSAMAGSVARWVAEGTVARLVCCTSGESQADDAEADPLEVAAQREREQCEAAAIVGYEDVTFMHRPDGAVANDLALREQLVRIIRTFRPDAVASSDPRVLIHEGGFVNDADHRTAAAAAIDAVEPAAANVMTFPHLVRSEGLEAHAVERLYLYRSNQPTDAVDITTTLDIKSQALRAHASGMRDAAGEDTRLEAAEAFAVVDRR